MNIFSRFLGKQRPAEDVLVNSIERLQIGIVTNLGMSYHSLVAPQEALVLAECVLCSAILIEPVTPAASGYRLSHLTLIEERAGALASDESIAEALSYLYAALTIHFAIRARAPLSEAAMRLGERAADLSIYIPIDSRIL